MQAPSSLRFREADSAWQPALEGWVAQANVRLGNSGPRKRNESELGAAWGRISDGTGSRPEGMGEI
jgi:hypothetical protein